MLLIVPPAARSCEPPPGVARVSGFLKAHAIQVRVLDLCQEGYEYLLSQPVQASDKWTQTAIQNRQSNLQLLRSSEGYANADRYHRAVTDLNRALAKPAAEQGITLTLTDYQDGKLSPVRRTDLLAAASDYAGNLFFPLFQRRLEEAFNTGPADVVGFSINFLSQALCAFAMIGFLRRAYPKTKIILGGGLVTSWIRQGRLSEEDGFDGLVDAIFPGKADVTLLEYLGISQTTSNAAPDYDELMRNEYFSPVRILPYQFTTGCSWKRCSFCPETAEHTAYSGLNPTLAGEEIEALVGKYSPGLLHFTDNEISLPYLKHLAAKPPGVPWYGFARFSRELIDPVFCRKLADSGCVMLQLGLESADQNVLDSLCKGIHIADVAPILYNLKSVAIATFVYLLFGTPAEGHAAALVTRDFVDAQSELIDFINVAIFNMPISGAEAKTLQTQAFYDGDLSLYCDFEHPSGWNRGKVRTFLKKEFETASGIRQILRRNPPIFTSNHAPFFVNIIS